MQYFNRLEEIKTSGHTVVTLGKFDGLHRGHRKLLKAVEEISERKGLKTAIFTFDISPQTKLGERENNVLITNREKRELIKGCGIDYLVECPFTDEVRNMTAEDFVKEVLIEKLKANAVVIGEDFRFGKGRQGSAKYLMDNSTEFGLFVKIIEKEKDFETGRDISSTFIREELIKGNMSKVRELLGFDYFISGEVVSGMKMGRGFGFPTINIIPESQKMLPPNGVYASVTEIDGVEYKSITNVGTKPTISGQQMGVETFILDFERDLYGKKVSVKLQQFQRPERKFGSIDELTTQVHKDIENRRRLL